MSGILRTARAVFSLLSPLTGTQSTGAITARASGANVEIPANRYLVPTDASLAQLVLVKTTAAATVTSAGVTITAKTAFGGASVNLPAGTVLRWSPEIVGIEPTCTVATAFSGGSAASGLGAVKSLRMYEQLGPSGTAEDLFKARVTNFPALVLLWDGSDRNDGSSRSARHYNENWVLAVVVSRNESDDLRRAEGLQILEEARELLTGRSEVDGEGFSSPNPIIVGPCRRLPTKNAAYIYTIRFTTVRTLERRDSREFVPWTVTQYDADTKTGTSPEVAVVDQARYEMP